MTAHVRRSGWAVSVALVGGLLAAPIGTSSAWAATPVEIQFVVADKDHDGAAGLYRHPSSAGLLTPVIAENAAVHVAEVASSRDGSRFAEIDTSYDAGSNPSRTRVAVYDVSGRLVRVAADVAASSQYLFGPALSPDGSTLVWSSYNLTNGAVTLLQQAVGSGPTTTLGNGFSSGVFLDSATVLASDESGLWSTLSLAGGAPHAAESMPSGASGLVLSTDGGRLAWSLDTTAGAAYAADIYAASVAVTNGVASIGGAVTVATGHHDTRPSWKRGGANIVFVRDDGTSGPGAMWTAQSNGSTPGGTQAADVGGAVLGHAIGVTDDGAAPSPATLTPATLNGTNATVHWAAPTDADLSGIAVTRSLDGTMQENIFVPAPATSLAESALVVGKTYSYAISAVDRSGNVSAGATRQLTAASAVPSFADPTATATPKAPFAVTFGADVPPSVTFTADYRPATAPAFTPWVTAQPGTSRTFGSAAATGVAATSSVPGTTYVFRVQATDSFGNSTALVTSAKAVVPFDQNRATLSGGTSRANSTAWLGSYRQLTATTHYARIAVTGDRFQVIGWRCPSCGVMDIYEGSTRVASVDTRAATTKARAVLYTRTWSKVGARTMTIKPRGTSGRPSVLLDGFAVRR